MCFPPAHMLYIYCVVSQIKHWNAFGGFHSINAKHNLCCQFNSEFKKNKLISFLRLGFEMVLKYSDSFDLLWFLQQWWNMLGNPPLLCLFMVENLIDLCNYKVGKMWPTFAHNVRAGEGGRWYCTKSILSVTIHSYQLSLEHLQLNMCFCNLLNWCLGACSCQR